MMGAISTRAMLALAAGVLLLLSACDKSDKTQTPGGAASLSGAGATFPAPLYARWAETYRATSGILVNYQAIGSGGGIKQIIGGTVDFGASDKPLKPDELDKNGIYQFPAVIGGVAPVLNLPGVAPGQVKLTGALLGDIYLGSVKTWADPQIAAANPGLKLPNLPITVVHRSDGSGTSFLFTTYLSGQNPAWAQKAGANDSVQWPTGIGGKGNDGVAAFVRQTPGAVGYVEYAYAAQNKLTYASLKNHDGQFVQPAGLAFSAAAAGADWSQAAGNYLLLIDQAGPSAWPITGATFILVPRQPADVSKVKAVLAFFDWAYRDGDAPATSLDYVPLPASVKALVRKQWTGLKAKDGQAAYVGG